MPELRLGEHRLWLRQGTDAQREDAPYVVFLHGAGSSSISWLYQLRALRKEVNCIAPDLPGHGKSDDRPGCDSVEGYADAVLEMLAALELDAVVLVGHSLGGAIALELARRAPERFSRVATLGTGPVIPVSPLIFEALRGSGEIFTRFLQALAFSPTTPSRFVEKSMAGGPQAPRDVIIRDFAACAAFDARPWLAEVVADCLVIVGRDDAMTPEPLAETLAEGLANGRLEAIHDAGHMAMLEQHKNVNEAIAAWLHA